MVQVVNDTEVLYSWGLSCCFTPLHVKVYIYTSFVCVFLRIVSVKTWLYVFLFIHASVCLCVCVCFCVSVSLCVCVCVTSRLAVWLKARPWEAAGWHQRTNCTHNNVRFHVNGRLFWPRLHGVGPSPLISPQHHHRLQGAVQLRRSASLDPTADCKLSISHWFPYSFAFYLFLCPSASVSLQLPFPLLSFHPSLSVSLFLFLRLCCWWWLFFLAGEEARWWFGPSDTAHFPLFLSLPLFPSFLWQSILGCASSAVYRRCSPKALH